VAAAFDVPFFQGGVLDFPILDRVAALPISFVLSLCSLRPRGWRSLFLHIPPFSSPRSLQRPVNTLLFDVARAPYIAILLPVRDSIFPLSSALPASFYGTQISPPFSREEPLSSMITAIAEPITDLAASTAKQIRPLRSKIVTRFFQDKDRFFLRGSLNLPSLGQALSNESTKSCLFFSPCSGQVAWEITLR